jgi:predicted permease
MSLLTKIQNLPQNKKIALIWIIVVIIAILLIILWVISAKFHKNVPPNNTIFNTIGQGIHNTKVNYGK